MMALDKKSEDHQSRHTLSSGHHECLHRISSKSMQYLLGYFSLDQRVGLTGFAIPGAVLLPLATNMKLVKCAH